MNLKNSQYQAIMRQYDQHQALHRQELDNRILKLYADIPEYLTLQADITKIFADRARNAILGRPSCEEDLKKAEAMQKRQKELMLEKGYPENYLEMTYTCPDCHDTGMIGDEKCHCFKQAMVNLLYKQSKIHEVLGVENFDHFRMDYYSRQVDKRLGISPFNNMEVIVSKCKDFIRNFDKEDRNLLFYGDTGVGKTFLTNCIARELLNTSHTVIYLSSFHLVDIMQNNTFGDGDTEEISENMFDYILDCDLLIIDDLGTELNNAFVTSQLFLCINERLLGRKSTIISTNLSIDDLQNTYSERVFSRLISNYEIMLVLGDDIRIRKAIT